MGSGTREHQARQVQAELADLRCQLDGLARVETTRSLTYLRHLSATDRQVIDQLGQRVVERLCHHLDARIDALSATGALPSEVAAAVLAWLCDEPTPGRDTDRCAVGARGQECVDSE